jgi:capsular polysaccharide transport system permease protein
MDSDEGDLDIDASLPGDPKPGTALARARAVSAALSDAARRRRLSTRRAARLSAGGFEGRRGARIARYLRIGSFLAVVVLPTLAAIVYFGFLAADQYVAEAEFTVSAGESPLRDGVESLSAAPLMLILQDTQIITNFLHSREIVDELQKRIKLRALYSTDKADFFARFDAADPVERLVKYWKQVSRAKVKLPGGLITFSVRAFSPEDAKLVADTTIALCDELVNRLNARINHDAVALAEIEFQRASDELAKTLAAEEVARNQSGMLETKVSAEAISTLVRQQKTSLLNLSGAYDTQLKYMNPDAAQMQELKARIDVLRGQIAKLEAQLTSAPGATIDAASAEGDLTVSAAMTKFGELEVRRKAAEHLYENAASALEHARIAAEFKLIYFKVYVQPSLPQESEYPSRGLDIFLAAVGSLATWGLLAALGSVVRNHMA